MNWKRRPVILDGVAYAPGRRFVVAAEGVYLHGMKSVGPSAWGGWRQDLQPGDVITCTGYGPGWGSDPGYGVEWTSEEAEAEGVSHCEIKPSAGSMWQYRPQPGLLRHAEEGMEQ